MCDKNEKLKRRLEPVCLPLRFVSAGFDGSRTLNVTQWDKIYIEIEILFIFLITRHLIILAFVELALSVDWVMKGLIKK